MDDIKDIERKGALSHFLNDKSLRTQSFGSNVSGERAYRRAERIVAALYLVTNHISPAEPARSAMRGAGVDLLSCVLGLRDEMRAAGSPAVGQAQAQVRKLISLVRILAVAGHLSLPNAEALTDALDELGAFLSSSQRSSLSESTVLTREELLDTGSVSAPLVRATQSDKRQKVVVKDRKSGVQMSDRANRTQARSGEILNVLNAQGTLGIRDIAAQLPEYSEKMIQRELKSLVSLGKAKKSGSKRWSMYSLAQ